MTPDLEPRRHGPCAPPHAPGTAPVHGAHGSSSPLAVCFSPVCRRPPRGRGCQRPPLATSTCHPGTPRPPHHPRVPGIKCKRLERARERSVQAAQGEGSAGSEELQVFLPCPHSTRGTSAPRPRQPALVCGSVLYRKSTRAGPGHGLGDPPRRRALGGVLEPSALGPEVGTARCHDLEWKRVSSVLRVLPVFRSFSRDSSVKRSICDKEAVSPSSSSAAWQSLTRPTGRGDAGPTGGRSPDDN